MTIEMDEQEKWLYDERKKCPICKRRDVRKIDDDFFTPTSVAAKKFGTTAYMIDKHRSHCVLTLAQEHILALH